MQHIGFAAGFHLVPNPPADQYRRELRPGGAPTSASSPRHHPDDDADHQRARDRARLRRAMASSSDAKVLACCLADVARPEPVSAAPRAASPTCEATASLILRIVLTASPPVCEARSANVFLRLATSRLSWLKVSPRSSR